MIVGHCNWGSDNKNTFNQENDQLVILSVLQIPMILSIISLFHNLIVSSSSSGTHLFSL